MQVLYLVKMKKRVKLKKGNKTIAGSVDFLEDMVSKGLGMMFRIKGKMILVAEREGTLETAIHTFFCRPMIVAWINSKNRVVDVKKTRPFWFYSSKEPAKYIFETTDLRTKIRIGDRIKFIKEK